ncbi:MAG: tRNA (adenosine(37)-N6)-threonylcarbamoyltransferase complex ATPase subunit type 1 TsaE [Marmoricola sp.]
MKEIRLVGPERARDVLAVIRGAFGDRPPLDPPATAMQETEESVAAALAEHGGLLGEIDGVPVAALLFHPLDDMLGLRRVGTLPAGRSTGIARRLVAAAEEEAARRGYPGLRLIAREELPATIRFWQRQGYTEAGRSDPQIYLRKLLPLRTDVPDADATHDLGRRLAGVLRAGDLVILTGDLGAGKTTFTQGIGAGLGVRGDVTSPTFVIARVHQSLDDGPQLVHVDAYRLGGSAELDDLDLDTDLDLAVTVVEWGEGLAESLAEDRLAIALVRAAGDETRTVSITPIGTRWFDAGLVTSLIHRGPRGNGSAASCQG